MMMFPPSSSVPEMTVSCLSSLTTTLPVFSVSCKTEVFRWPSSPVVRVVLFLETYYDKNKYLNALKACTSALCPLLANHVPLIKTKSVIAFHSFGSIMEIFFFFPPVMFILYMITCTEDLKLFYLHRGNTFKMHFSLSLFFKQKTEYLKIFSGICKRNLRV